MGNVIRCVTCTNCVRPPGPSYDDEAVQYLRAGELVASTGGGGPRSIQAKGQPYAGLQQAHPGGGGGLACPAVAAVCAVLLLAGAAAATAPAAWRAVQGLAAGASRPPGGSRSLVPKPTAEQLSFLDVGLAQFVHYDINPWSYPHVEHNCAETGTMTCLPASKFNPTNLSTDQWVQAAVDFGAKEVCLTAHHEGGFALWPTKHNLGYSVAASPFQGDIVREFADSCRRHGMRICYYFGPNSNGWLLQKSASAEQFLELQHAQLRELLTEYGPVSRLWWDHYLLDAFGEGETCNPGGHTPCPQGSFPAAWASFTAQVRAESPGTLICPGPDCMGHLWEGGMGTYPVWLTCAESAAEPGTCFSRDGVKGGGIFMPRETCVTPTSSGWFADGEGDQMAFTLVDYWRHFLNSVGIGMVNTVNAPPGTTGQIHGSITAVMRAFGAAARPLYLPDASAGPATADCASLVVYLDVTKGFNAVVSREDLSQGQRLAAYTVEALQGFSTWVPLAPPCAAPVVSTQTSTGCIHGLSVGAMVVDVVDWVRSPPRQVRFRCLESLADPVSLRSFAVAEVDLPSELW